MLNRYKIFLVLLIWTAFSFAGSANSFNAAKVEIEEVEEVETSKEDKESDFISAWSNDHKSIAADGGNEISAICNELTPALLKQKLSVEKKSSILSARSFLSEPLFILYCSLKICFK